MTTETNKQLCQSFHKSFDMGDKAAFLAICAPNMVATMPGGPGPMDLESFFAAGSGFVAAFSQAKHTILSQIAEGDLVATKLIWSGVHTHEFAGMPATNRAVSIEAVSVDRIENGRIVSHDAYFDLAGFMGQLSAKAA